MPDIRDLLQRRSDLSTFLVHMTKGENNAARDALMSILTAGTIEARSAFGLARSWAEVDQEVLATQRCVCFTETPLEHTWMMVEDIHIDGTQRDVRLAPWGLAFTKTLGRRQGVNPVWYIDRPNAVDWLSNPINTLVRVARDGRGLWANGASGEAIWTAELAPSPSPAAEPILKVTPFIELMGHPNFGTRKEFWWEREWRKVGDFVFDLADVAVVLAPEAEHVQLRQDILDMVPEVTVANVERLSILDPAWGLERMIAALVRVPEADVGPFP